MFKSPTAKANKPLIIYGFVMLGLLITLIIGLICVKVAANQMRCKPTEVGLFVFMPDKIDFKTDNGHMVYFRKEKNPDFDISKDEEKPLMRYKYYAAIGDEKEREYAYDEEIHYDNINGAISAVFLVKTMEKVSGIKSAAVWVILAVVAVIVVSGILCWFFSWSNMEDLRKETLYGNKKNKKKSN